MWWVGGWFVGTLLGPERAGSPCEGGGLLAHVRAFLFLVPLCHLWVVGSGGVVWGVSGRTLRTAQWTRASLDSCKFREFL